MISMNPMQTSLSGLMAHRRGFEAVARNVANVSTEGYIPVSATFESSESGGVNVRYRREQSAGASSGVDLNEEAVNAMAYKIGYQANLSAIRVHESMLGSLMDMMG